MLGAVLAIAQPAAAATNFYVDCVAGNDTNSGQSPGNAWRTLGRANQADLDPGDTLRLKRGCSFEGRLDVSWNGTASNPITVATYHSGPKPVIWNDGVLNSAIKVTGRHLEIRSIEITFEQTSFDPCGQPLGTFYGINFTEGARFVTASQLEVSKATVGAHISVNSSDITVIDNVFRDNNVMNVWGGDPSKELGAWGVLIRSDRNVVAHNEFRDNVAVCVGGNGKIHSNSAEIYEGDDNYVHSNWSNDRVFSELGGSAGNRAEDNVFEHNTHISDIPLARFMTTRGADSSWGPVRRTTAEYNHVVLRGAGSVAISCGAGCNTNILTLRHNVLSATEKALYTDEPIIEQDNVYWNPSGGDVHVQYNDNTQLYSPVPTPVLNGSIVGNPNVYSPQADPTPPPGLDDPPPPPTTTTTPPTTTTQPGTGGSNSGGGNTGGGNTGGGNTGGGSTGGGSTGGGNSGGGSTGGGNSGGGNSGGGSTGGSSAGGTSGTGGDTPGTSGSFVDDDGLSHEAAIEAIRAAGITQGCADDRYCPNDLVTRGQMAAFISRALHLPASTTASGFTDTAGTFADYIERIYAAGITTGCDQQRYCTYDFVTRGQMAAFISRALSLPPSDVESGFTDSAGTFADDIERLYAAGITVGCGPQRYCTDAPVTRAEMATFIARALRLIG